MKHCSLAYSILQNLAYFSNFQKLNVDSRNKLHEENISFQMHPFWVKVGKIKGFSLISTPATKSLPVSKSCERIFPKVYLLKTNLKNRFTVNV